jgi:hypothetical protein
MHFRRIALCAMGVCLASIASTCKQKSDATIHWLVTPVKIDGQFEDWDNVPSSRMHEDHAVLKLASDSQALYIYYVTDDMDAAEALRRRATVGPLRFFPFAVLRRPIFIGSLAVAPLPRETTRPPRHGYR